MQKSVRLSWDILPQALRTAALERWGRLHDRVSGCALIGAEAIALALEHFGDGSERFVFARLGDEDVLALVVKRERAGVVSVFLPSQLQLAPILNSRPSFNTRDMRDLLSAFSATGCVLRLFALDPARGALLLGAVGDEKTTQLESPYIELPPEREDYMDLRSTKFRSDLRRRRKKAESEIGMVRFEIVTAPDAVAAAVARYGALEESGWKGQAGTAVAADSPQFRFYEQWLFTLAQRGLARVFELYIGGQIAAMRLAISERGCLYMLKVSHAEKLRAYSPGAMIIESVIEYCYLPEANVRRIEFYGKVAESHQPWLTSTRAISMATVYRKPWMMSLVNMLRSVNLLPKALSKPNRFERPAD
jgi:Acetyltransferase (GNAT) domain